MELNYILYFIEIILLIIALIFGLYFIELKKKKGYLKFLIISLLIFLISVSATFIMEKPSIKYEDTQTIEVNSIHSIAKAKTKYHFRDITEQVIIDGEVNFDQIGEYEIEYIVPTWVGNYKVRSKIKIVDTQKPEIILEGEEDYSQSYASEFEEPGYKAIDEYDGDLTENVTTEREDIDEQNFIIRYTVSDSSGNTTEVIRNVTIVDDVGPVIKLNGNENMTVYLDSKYEEKGATAVDEKDGDVSESIVIEGSVDTSKEGKYTITYKAKDSKGNETTKERIVNVKKKIIAQNTQGQNGNGNGVIYLTFDDGPSTSITPKILDILSEKNVKATFFILNYNGEGEKLVKREYSEGHTVAIHGYSHEYSTIYQSEDAFMENITKLQTKIQNTTGYKSNIIRFPGGSSNMVSRFNPGIMTRLCSLVIEKGFRYYDWNVSSGDAGGAKTSTDVYNNVTKGLSKSKQNVVLMHDFSGNTKTLNALESIIDYGIQNGYSFSKITEDTPMVTHSVNN